MTSTSQAQLGHVRRSSLPVAPMPEVIANSVQGHSVSLAPETIPEAPEGLESPRPQFRHKYTLSSMSSPTLSMRSCNYDTSVSTAGPSTPLNARVSTKRRKSKKCSKKGGKRKRSSAIRRPESQSRREDDSAPPSYEMAMQQAISETVTPVPPDDPTTSAATAQVNESTQTSVDASQPSLETIDQVSPTERLLAVREMFRRISDSERSDAEVAKEPAHQAARRPTVPATRIKGNRARGSGGTISRGTVKARKAMLLNKAQKPQQECSCNGACSCAHFSPEVKTSKDLRTGTVKSKINYYLSIEESAKKRERDSSAERSDVDLEPQDPQSPQSDGSNSNSNQKKRKLVRNQSAPALSHLRERNLEIYFSNDGVQEDETISPTEEDMERPLITPVSGSPKPIFLPAQDSKAAPDMVGEEAATPSIKTRVRLYNKMCDTPTDSSPSRRRSTPSPLRSPIFSPKENLIYRADSIESLDENKESLICMRTMKIPVCDTPIKPGLVKEAKAKFITALSHDIRPKLCFQDSDDWNVGNESPVPIRIPYLNLQNEEVNSPDLSDGEKLIMPPLKQEEAESIELWDASSQGKSELVNDLEDDGEDLPVEKLPSPESGAVPKRPAVIAKANAKPVEQQVTASTDFKSTDNYQVNKINIAEVRAKSKLKLNLKDKFSPASDTEKEDTSSDAERNPSRSSTPSQPHEYDLVVMHLGGPTSASSVASEDESPPPSPRRRTKVPVPSTRQTLQPDLNETIDSEIDLEEPSSDSGISSSTKDKPQEVNPKSKIPIPSPRGSKLTSVNAAKSENASGSHPASRKEVLATPDTQQAMAGPSGIQTIPSSPSPVPSSRASTPSTSPRSPKSPQRPTLSPQMERSGIITIDTSKHTSWDYI